MPHPHHDDIRKAHGEKLKAMGGKGEFPPHKAARIAEVDNIRESASGPEEKFVAAPPRQVSNYGNLKGK